MKNLRIASAAVIIGIATLLGAAGSLVKGVNDKIAGVLSLQTRTLSENQTIASGVDTLLDVETAYADVPNVANGPGCGGCNCGGGGGGD